MLAVVAALAATPAGALGPVPFGPGLAAQGWQELTFRGRTPAEFRDEGANRLRIRTDGAASVIYRVLPEAFADGGQASWRWRVDAAVPPTDLSRRGADDRALALYFLFADDEAARSDPPGSLTAAMRRGRALVYVWGGAAARRSVIESPHMRGRGRLIVQQRADAPTGGWLDEAVDLRADFRAAFGREPGPLVGVGVSADSDDTGTRGDGQIADLVIR